MTFCTLLDNSGVDATVQGERTWTMNALNDLLDDLNAQQYRDLMSYLWTRGYKVSRASLKSWRKQAGLPR